MAEVSAMDGQIASAEGERDATVNDYLASMDGLGAVIARSHSLDVGVTFPSADNAQQMEARQAAIARVRAFMARAADQIAAAVTFAREQVPGRLGGLAEATKAGIQGAMETEKAAISDRIAQARAQARAGAAAARAHVHAEYANSAAQIEASTVAAIAALDAKHETSVGLVDEKETTGLHDVNSRFAAGRARHEAKGPEYGALAILRGQQHAHQYERCKTHPKTGIAYGDDGFWDGCLTVRRAKAQQDAACKTAAGYKDVFLRTANKKGYDLRELRKQYRCAVIAGARQVNQTLDDTHDRLVSGLESGRTQALDGLAFARDQNLAAVDRALAATLKSLSAQEFSQRQAVNDAGYLKQLAVEQLAHSSAANLARGISAAMDSLEQTLTTLRGRFARSGVPEPESLSRSLAMAEVALGGGMGTLLDTMEGGTRQAEARIEGLGAAALDALLLLTTKNDELSVQAESSFAQQMGGLKTGTTVVFSRLTDNHVQQARQASTQGTASMEQAVAGFDRALATIGGRVDGAIITSLQELDRDLGNKLGELDGQIAREAWKAAEKEQPAWKSVVAIVLIILVIIAAAVISIVTLGAGASLFAVILVGALVGAVSGGLIQLINNWASGEAWHHGVVRAMVMGAVGGAIGGGLGFAGGALAMGAAAGGARAVTQLAISLGADLLSEGITQTFGYVAFGQEFNWQGFVMAGAMSGVSFRPAAGVPRPGAPAVRAAGAAGGRRAAVAQIAGGATVGLGIEYATAKISGQEFDLTRAASAAASGAVGARAARRAPAGPTPEPTTRLGRAAQRLRTFDPGELGARLGERLEGFGARMVGPRPEVEVPAGARPSPTEEPTPTRPREEAPATRPPEETAPSAPSRRPVPEPEIQMPAAPPPGRVEAPEGGRVFSHLTDAEINAAFARAEAGPLVRVGVDSLGVEMPSAPRPVGGEATLPQRQRAGALREGADRLTEQANGLLSRATDREAEAGLAEAYNPRRGRALREEAGQLLDRAVELEQRAGALRREAEEFASGRRSATEDLPGPEDVDALFAGLEVEAPGLIRVPLSDVERNPALLPRLIRPLLTGEGGGRLVFRVESERSRSLVHVDADGNVRVEGGAAAHLNFGSFERALEFVMQNSRGNARIIRFEVDEDWVRAARSAAIPEYETAPLAGRQPRLVDVRFAEGQLEIPASLINELNRFIVPGSGVVHEIPAPRPTGPAGGGVESAAAPVTRAAQPGSAEDIPTLTPRPETEPPTGSRRRDDEAAGRPVEEPGMTRPPSRGETGTRPPTAETPERPAPLREGDVAADARTASGTIRSTSDGTRVASERNVVVGAPLATEAQARTVLRSIMQDQPAALRALGVSDVPEGFRPTSVEWGLGQLPDGRFVVIRGEAGAVDWSHFPGVRAVAHTHPSTNALRGGQGPQSEMSIREALGTDVNRTALLPSGQDLAYVAREGLDTHTVFTPFEYRGNGRIANAVPGSGLPRVEVEIRGARLEGYYGELPAYRAELVARSSTGEILWQGTVYGMPHPYLGQVLDFRPPPGLRPPTPDDPSAPRLPPEAGGDPAAPGPGEG
jgi:hypothetical protein